MNAKPLDKAIAKETGALDKSRGCDLAIGSSLCQKSNAPDLFIPLR
jgi:hypothetical protein